MSDVVQPCSSREASLFRFPAGSIWAENPHIPNDFVIFRRTFSLDEVPAQASAWIAADTRYWLYLNERLVVWEGGLFRESLPGVGYADEIELSPYLRKGENTLAALVWYYGNEGRNNVDSGSAGFLFACDALKLYADADFLCKRHAGFYGLSESKCSHLYGGHDTGWRAGSPDDAFYKADADESEYVPATVYDSPALRSACPRPIPQLRVSSPVTVQARRTGTGYVVAFPHGMWVSPCFEAEAEGGETILLRSDRYDINGGPGECEGHYFGQLMEVTCQQGRTVFQAYPSFYGESYELICPPSVRLIRAGYRESGYDSDIIGSFTCDCDVTNRLIQKAARTLYICMRDNFMDCPDRERGQWVGDVAVQVPQAMYMMDHRAVQLIRKAIEDFILLRKGDVLVGNVPGAHFSELPGQSLNAIGEFGLIAQYYRNTLDTDILRLSFEPCVRYLMLWEMGDDGLVLPRKGDWRWFDHLQNVDETVLENAFYYTALKFAQFMADTLEDHRYDDFLKGRIQSIAASFEPHFWKGKFYASSNFADDRANAIAVLSGLADPSHYPAIRELLISVFQCSVYMENYVLTALCEMGYIQDAYRRMVSRYYNLAMNENSTLWEDFFQLGTRNHAWSGAPVTIAFRYFMGVTSDDGYRTYRVGPSPVFRNMSCTFPTRDRLIHADVRDGLLSIREEPLPAC